MHWIEIITLRASGMQINDVVVQLFKENFRGQKAFEQNRVKLYRHATVETDISIHIYWDGKIPGQSKSPLGIQIESMLSDFGLVSHFLWKEEAGYSKGNPTGAAGKQASAKEQNTPLS